MRAQIAATKKHMLEKQKREKILANNMTDLVESYEIVSISVLPAADIRRAMALSMEGRGDAKLTIRAWCAIANGKTAEEFARDYVFDPDGTKDPIFCALRQSVEDAQKSDG